MKGFSTWTKAERVSLPPKPPPMRLTRDTILCIGTPSTPCSVTWCFVGACGMQGYVFRLHFNCNCKVSMHVNKNLCIDTLWQVAHAGTWDVCASPKQLA